MEYQSTTGVDNKGPVYQQPTSYQQPTATYQQPTTYQQPQYVYQQPPSTTVGTTYETRLIQDNAKDRSDESTALMLLIIGFFFGIVWIINFGMVSVIFTCVLITYFNSTRIQTVQKQEATPRPV